MTTLSPFLPTATKVFSFAPTLDGVQFNAIIAWNLAGRWYLNLYDLNGTLILCCALISSPDDYDINMLEQYFNSTLVFRESTQNFEVTP